MKRGLFMFWFMFVYLICQAQIFKQISTNDGLSHRHVYSIIQDHKGYMWFLTHDGIDRFNGSEYKHYTLLQQNHKLNTSVNLKELFYTSDKTLWQMGANGQVFRYSEGTDQFEIIYSYPTEPNQTTMLDFGYIDNSQHIWMGNKGNIQIYNYQKRKSISITQHPLYASSSVAEMGNERYAIGTYQGVYLAEIRNDSLVLDTQYDDKLLTKLPVHIDYLYYHKESNQLIIATLKDGVYTYNFATKQLSSPLKIRGTSVNQIVTYTNNEVLIATSGAGVYKLDITTNILSPFIIADYSTYDGMSGNNIKDIYIDKERQIWLATYPTGITVCQENQTSFTWYKHILKDNQSLIHDEVNYVTEDSDGDLWFATTNGVSLLQRESNKWRAYLSTYNDNSIIANHMFVSLSEVRPGILWAGGYNSGIYEINKRTGQVKLVTENNSLIDDQQPERNVKAILTTSDQNIWVGGQYNLRQIDYKTKNVRFFSELSSVTSLEEKDESSLWVGTARGLYILDKKTGKSRKVVLPNQISFINSLSQSNSDDNLYIGTNEGLVIFITKDGTFKHFHKNNSRLISNDIRTIIAGRDNEYVYFAYEKALGRLQTSDYYIRNWTKDQGLPIGSFAQNSGEQLDNGNFIFGSADGAILFSKNYLIPEDYRSTLVFEELEINQNKISPSGYNKILTTSLDNTKELILNYDENNLTLKVASINFRYPSNISYTWVMEGLYDRWSYPSTETKVSFNNLSPGKYLFRIKALSNEDNAPIQERQLSIVIKSPFWWNLYSKIIYLIIIVIIIIFIVRYFTIRFKKQIENDTKQLYYNAAHDVKIPLQLIKESLQQINDDEKSISKEGTENIRVILRNINDILAKNDSVINYERMEQSKERLFLSEHHLSKFIYRIVDESQTYAEFRNTKLVLTDNLDAKDGKSLFDKEKVNNILLTLINEVIKRTGEGKTIEIILSNNLTQWLVLIAYEGEPITLDEIKHDNQEENSTNLDIESTPNLGLSLVSKLVQIHKGEIQILNNERTNINKVSVIFPIFGNSADLPINDIATHPLSKNRLFSIEHTASSNKTQPIVLIAEDTPELIQELTENLKDQYQIEIASSGKEAIELAIQLRPDIILSKMYLTDMKGTALAFAIKSNLETSHIAFMVMTDKNDEKHIIKGLENGPDDFILKPFNYRILKASMQNLLESKAILKDRYASLELQESLDCQYCSTNLDWKFIATVKSEVESHMAEPDFNIDKLCSILNMSRTSFYNKLKDLTNQSPSDFIKIIKLKHAAQQLITGEYTIVEIAEQTGFNDAKYFREVFKKHFNMTPSKYAKENKL